MEKKINDQNNNGEVKGEKKKLTAKVKDCAVKAWHSAPGKVIRTIGAVALEVGTTCVAVGFGTRVMLGEIDRHYGKREASLPEAEPEAVPFNESEPTDVE